MRYSNCSCNNYNCTCGRKTVLQQSVSGCCTSGATANFCKEPIAYVTTNFTVPVANVEVDIEVSNSTSLYIGQGIKIGSYYFQITTITDAKNIGITHNGLATVGAVMLAKSTAYGCYALPIYYAGIVQIAFTTADIEGVDENLDPVEGALSDSVLAITYGYLGPKKIQFNLELSVNINSAIYYIQLPLPNATSQPNAAFSGYISLTGVYATIMALKDNTNILIGPGGVEGTYEGGATTLIVNGEYEL